MTSPQRIVGILFDKDGTLFDFGATWDVWAGDVLDELAQGDARRLAALAEVACYDLGARRFLPHSPIIAGTNREAAECLAQALPGVDIDALEQHLMLTSSQAPLVPAVPLAPLLDGFLARGLSLGVMTNDTEFGARTHLATAGVADRFHFIAGFDSGHGAKPSPQPLLAFAIARGLEPGNVIMVGDSAHDLIAGREAGMLCVGVLTGPAPRAALAPLADVVLPDIGHLPDWIRGRDQVG
ncbi:HAD family hydrolase [Puniceibacterium sp. IMCC21224]|uniref:HAD family hydrolase n=1 Tax=Puniceibacterium sp. IMCC21224 TaxID=1618204 RepID=UPI00064E0006|nr:HAD family hydrolase [Puniceibacterium sp. IMCC21224]KMK68098.1 haloacid dehalogenase superfamily enzyme, subfamily IA [Puniceibacterium sp. IMCC21224]